MLYGSDATSHQALHGIGFIVEVDGGKVSSHTKEAGYNDGEEHSTHYPYGKAIDTSVDKGKRFEE